MRSLILHFRIPGRVRRLALMSVALLMVPACFPRHPSSGVSGADVSLAEIGRQPQQFADRTILSRGWVVDTGQTQEGSWVALAVSADALARVRVQRALASDVVVLLFPPAASAELSDDLRGKELEMMLRVEQPVVLADGRSAVRAYPLQVAAIKRFAPEATRQVPAEMLDRVAKQQSPGQFFRDPRLPASRASKPAVRFTFLDPALPRPYWYLPGPVSIEKAGSPVNPDYRFTSVMQSKDGSSKESICRFRVDDGNLRSVAYDEVVRDAKGKQVDEQHLNFLNGTVMDKITGARGPWPANIYAGPCLGLALGGYPFTERRSIDFFLWSDYEPAAAMYAILDGIESVTVPAGTFDCYRLRMNVDTERMLRRLVLPSARSYDMARDVAAKMRPADTVMWLTTAWPHVVVKTEGNMGPPGTSRSVMELVDLDAATRTVLGASAASPRR